VRATFLDASKPGARLLAGIPCLLVLIACGGSDPPATLELRTREPVLEATLPAPTETAAATMTPARQPTATPSANPPTATPTATPSPTASATATMAPTATATPPPTPTVPEGAVGVTAIDFDPAVGNDGDGETVMITNAGSDAVDLSGWTLSDIAEHVYTFPAFVLQPGASVTIHICSGEDSAEVLYWGRCSAIWNNDGDTAYLRDATGRDVSTFSY
jgi:hypothetical protein